MSWYLRSLAERNTHCGHYSIVTRNGHRSTVHDFLTSAIACDSRHEPRNAKKSSIGVVLRPPPRAVAACLLES